MRCCVAFCENTSENVSTSEWQEKGISFHCFPSEVHLRAAWLKALGKQDSHLPDSAVVCSQHFLNDDIQKTESGLRQIVTGAIPSTVQVCMICLDTDTKLILMRKHRLEEAYGKLTGRPLCDQGNLKQTVCVQCAQRLINFSRFRDKSLRARALMMDLVEKHELITRQHIIEMISHTKHQLKSNMVLTMLEPNHCDLHIQGHPSEDKQTELEESHHTVVVKTEESDDSMRVNGDMEVIHEDDNNVNNFDQDQLKLESVSFKCTLCLEEFIHEHEYMQHLGVHFQNGDGNVECAKSQEYNMVLTTLVPDQCDLHILEHPSEDKPELNKTGHIGVMKTERINDSMSYDGGIEVKCENGPDVNYFFPDPLKYESASFQCTLCLEEFVHEHEYMRHMSMHLQNGDSDDDCATSQVCKPHTAVSSSSSLSTENRQADPSPSTPATSQNEVPKSEYIVPVTNISLQSKTYCLNNASYIHYCNNSMQNSSHTEKISKTILDKHIEAHSIVKLFPCGLCKYKSDRKCNLLLHMKTHRGGRCYICKICNKKYVRNNHLTRHMRTHTGEMPFSCKICEHKCSDKWKLERHMRTHTGDRRSQCNNYLQSSSQTENISFICDTCGKTYKRKDYLVKHIKVHSIIKRFPCTLCDYKCNEKDSLVLHMRTHTGEKPYACNLCKYKCAVKCALNTHMRTHTGEKSYTCRICDGKFARNDTLVRHIRTHTGEKPFTCELCEFKCAQESSLAGHMRRHTGKKPYSCTICEYKSSDKAHLDRHMRTHTGEKPYNCKVCNKKFTRNRYLFSHMRKHSKADSHSTA